MRLSRLDIKTAVLELLQRLGCLSSGGNVPRSENLFAAPVARSDDNGGQCRLKITTVFAYSTCGDHIITKLHFDDVFSCFTAAG